MNSNTHSILPVFCLLLLGVALWGWPVAALSHPGHKHVHGEGQLQVVIDGPVISLDLKMPLESVVGFERPPRNEAERTALANAERTLADAAAIWQPTPAARCAVESATVNMPALKKDAHADVTVQHRFRCEVPEAIRGIQTTLFTSFKRLKRIEAQRVGPAGQGSQRLTRRNSTLTW